MNESKFDGKGKLYSQYRPSYPSAFIDYLFEPIGPIGITKESIIADIGSGTGILSRQLLEKCCCVYGVEPNSYMRTIAENTLKEIETFKSVCGSAENTNILSNSIDFITVAQAFHWFDAQTFKNECKRILKPGGMVILVWNSSDNTSKLVIENNEINRKYCPNYKGFSNGMRNAINEGDFSDFFHGKYQKQAFQNNLIFDLESFIGKNLSASYSLKDSDIKYNDYVSELKELYQNYSSGRQLIMPNVTRCYFGYV